MCPKQFFFSFDETLTRTPSTKNTVMAAKSETVKLVVVGESAVGKTAIIQRFTDDNFTEDFKATVGADFSSKTLMLPKPSTAPRDSWAAAALEEHDRSAHGPDSETDTRASSKRRWRQSLAEHQPGDSDFMAASSETWSSTPPRRQQPTSKTDAQGIPVTVQLWDTAGQERFRSLSLSYFKGCDAALIVFDVSSLATFERIPNWMEEVRRGTGRMSLEGFPVFVVANKLDRLGEPGSHWQSIEAAAAACRERFGLTLMSCSAKSGLNVESVFLSVVADALDFREEEESQASSKQYQQSSLMKQKTAIPLNKNAQGNSSSGGSKGNGGCCN